MGYASRVLNFPVHFVVVDGEIKTIELAEDEADKVCDRYRRDYGFHAYVVTSHASFPVSKDSNVEPPEAK